jgi:hypothetical protein
VTTGFDVWSIENGQIVSPAETTDITPDIFPP